MAKFRPIGSAEQLPPEAVIEAVKEELRFWVGIMDDHAKFMRNGFDPTEEELFRRADELARELDEVKRRVDAFSETTPRREVAEVEERAVGAVRRLRGFKLEVIRGIRECRILTELPAELIDHLRREADYFLGVVDFLHRRPLPRRDELGLPDSDRPVHVLPVQLIPFFRRQAFAIGVDLSLFWLKVHAEHAGVLVLFYRPVVQADLIRRTSNFQQELDLLYRRALEVDERRSGLRELLREVRPAMEQWRDFLAQLFEEIRRCRVPTGQVNFPARLADHMRREADYYLAIISVLRESEWE
ncbi:MAG: DUF2935 domain-containing protein, partial [Bacillota bacterium]|nr:DUF2935 domain-containing protein [Bacillota bacterium]